MNIPIKKNNDTSNLSNLIELKNQEQNYIIYDNEKEGEEEKSNQKLEK